MSPLESRAWLSLWAMGPVYIVYFTLQNLAPAWLVTTPQRLICLGATATVHAIIYVIGLLVLSRKERGEGLMADERDRAIEANATRVAYYGMMAGTIVVGVMKPFNEGGWQIVNGALFVIVLCEVLRNILILRGYRGTPHLAE